jgi:Amiloride-sensitive sodium channel
MKISNCSARVSAQICYHLHLPEKRARDVRAMSAIFYTRDFPTDSIRTFDTSLRVSPTPSVDIVLHERGSYPVTTLAVNVAPGHETTVSIRATIVQRLGKPFDNCEPIQ